METCVPEGYRIHMNDCNVPHNPDDCTCVQPLVNAANFNISQKITRTASIKT